MRIQRVCGAVGFVLVLGACEVHVGSAPPPGPTPPPQPVVANNPPPPPPVIPHAVVTQTPAPPPTPHARFTMRIIHPPPAANVNSGQLDVGAMRAKLRLKPTRKCGPRETPPGSGHWVNIDCVKYKPLLHVVYPRHNKMAMLRRWRLRLDT